MDLGLKDLVAIVTASSKGLGRATAVQLAREGTKVVICARGEEALYATRDEITALGGQVLAVAADVAAPETPQVLVDAALERFARLDILVANAGGPPPGEFLAFEEQDWDAAIQLTLMSFVRLCYAAIPALKRSGRGSILACTSITVKQPLPNLVLSNSLRLAVTGLVKTLADELGPDGVRVNAICPGSTRTDRIEQLLADRAARASTTVDEQAAQMAAEIPLGRIGQPEEFGRVAAFLSSPAASFVNGVSLLVDGGAYRGSM
jgi:3-oxoacyl-[acyl-carrier protein] reductase